MDENSIKKRLIYLIISEAKSVGVNVDGDMFFALAFRSEEELTKIARGIGVSLPVMQKNITHLTLAGTYAGHTYCGAPRGDTKCAHMPYVIDQLQWAKDHILCEECIQVLADSLLINKQKNDKH